MAVSYSIPPRLNFALGAASGLAGAMLWRAPWRPETSLAEWLLPLVLAIGFSFGLRAAGLVGLAVAALSARVLWENAQFADVDAAGLQRGTVAAILLCISAAALFGAVAVAQAQRTTADESGPPRPR